MNNNNNTFWKILSAILLTVIVLELMVFIPMANSLIDRLEIAEGAQYQAERELRALQAKVEDDTLERRVSRVEKYVDQEEKDRW